jgi:hypothetical protein
VADESAFAQFLGQTSHDMLIPPGYASDSVEKIYQPDFEELELEIPGGDGEKTLKDALYDIILWPKHYIIIIPENDRSPRDPLEPLQLSPGPSSSLHARSPSSREPYDNSGEASSSDHDDDIPPNSPQQPSTAEHAPHRSRAQSFKSVQPPKKKRTTSKEKARAKEASMRDETEQTKAVVDKEVADWFAKVREKTLQKDQDAKNEGSKERL